MEEYVEYDRAGFLQAGYSVEGLKLMTQELCTVNRPGQLPAGLHAGYVDDYLDIQGWPDGRIIGLLFGRGPVGVILYDYIDPTTVVRRFICGQKRGQRLNEEFEKSILQRTREPVTVFLVALPDTIAIHARYGYTVDETRDTPEQVRYLNILHESGLTLMKKTVSPPAGGRRLRRTARLFRSTSTRRRRRHRKSLY